MNPLAQSASNHTDIKVNKMNVQQGYFISFEGTEGVGKTTAIDQLCAQLEQHNIEYVRTREPGGSELAEKLRNLLLNPETCVHDETELLLMFAARNDHLYQIILPALQRGQWVICDRFTDSTIAYQGFGRGHAQPDILKKIHTLIDDFVPRLPDMTIWLDLPIAEGMKRAGKRGQADRFEQQTLDFFTRVYQGFDDTACKYPERIHKVDASGSKEQVAHRIWSIILPLLKSSLQSP